MKAEYLAICRRASSAQRVTTNSNQKILRGFRATMYDLMKDDLHSRDVGFTDAKMRRLSSLYLNEESIEAGKQLWRMRTEKNKYGSVGISTYGHFIKPERPTLGPCLQAVVITRYRYEGKWTIAADVYYRSTELYKKFPADLIWLRDIFFPTLEIEPRDEVKFWFSNVTVHPMYWVTYGALLPDPIAELEMLKKTDAAFYKAVVHQISRHEQYAPNFSQMKRAFAGAEEVMGKPMMRRLIDYCHKQKVSGVDPQIEEDDEE